MNVLLSTIGRRGYVAEYFREAGASQVIGTTDRHSLNVEFTVGLLSCDKSYVVPSINSGNYINTVLDICKKEHISLVCSLFDIDCHTLSDYKAELWEVGALPLFSDRRVNDICLDKLRTFEFLKTHGFGTPATYSTIEDFQRSNSAFPAIVKPRYGFASLNMFRVTNEFELQACFKQGEHIIQEVLEGQEHSFDILNGLDGMPLSCVVKRKIKMRAGETDQAITVRDSQLLELAVNLSETLKHIGPMDVDLFVQDGQPKILEMNPRFGGGYPLSHAAGAKFPELMLEIARGGRPSPIIGNYTENIVLMKDIKAIAKPLSELGKITNDY